MADKSALQMLQQLPAQAPTRTQNPMWAFLKGIEGFDETRAAECLGRLLDAHYDTIGVLRLATKQDLIDDVGLKAGDALRIVSAAKRAVPRPKSALTAALPWASKSCESQEQRRKRAKTSARETWESGGQDVVKQAALRKEIVIHGATVTVPLHACGVCNVVCESETELRLHFDSATHAHSMDLVVKTGEFNNTTYLFCSICNVTFNGTRPLLRHYNGKKHKQTLVRKTLPPEETPTIPVEAPTISSLGATVKIEGSSTVLPSVIGPSPPFLLPMQKPALRDPASSSYSHERGGLHNPRLLQG